MTELCSEAELELKRLPAYLDQITARLLTFEATATRSGNRIDFAFPFGQAWFDMEEGRLRVGARATDRDGLARVKDLIATAYRSLCGRREGPSILWRGDLAGETRLPQFREMTVVNVLDLTPRMRRFPADWRRSRPLRTLRGHACPHALSDPRRTGSGMADTWDPMASPSGRRHIANPSACLYHPPSRRGRRIGWRSIFVRHEGESIGGALGRHGGAGRPGRDHGTGRPAGAARQAMVCSGRR